MLYNDLVDDLRLRGAVAAAHSENPAGQGDCVTIPNMSVQIPGSWMNNSRQWLGKDVRPPREDQGPVNQHSVIKSGEPWLARPKRSYEEDLAVLPLYPG